MATSTGSTSTRTARPRWRCPGCTSAAATSRRPTCTWARTAPTPPPPRSPFAAAPPPHCPLAVRPGAAAGPTVRLVLALPSENERETRRADAAPARAGAAPAQSDQGRHDGPAAARLARELRLGTHRPVAGPADPE